MKDLTPEQILQSNKQLRKAAEKQAGIDSEKVQQTVSEYMQIARDSQLNYIELLQVFAIMKETVLQFLNKLSISTFPAIISDVEENNKKDRKGKKMEKEIDETIEVICKWIRDMLEDENVIDISNVSIVSDMTKALAELISARK